MKKMPAQASESSAAVRHLGGQTAVVMGGTVFTFLVGLPFQIYLARSLGAAGLGLVGIAEALVLATAGVLSLGLAPLALRFIPEYRIQRNNRAIRLLVVFGVFTLAGLGGLGVFLMVPLTQLLPAVFAITPEALAIMDVMALFLPLSMLAFFLAQALRGFQEIRVMVFSTSILALSAKVAITIVLFATYGASARTYVWAMVLSQALAILPMAWALWRLLRALPIEPEPHPKPVDRRAWASYAGTNYASGLLNSMVGNLDRVVIGALLGSTAVGILMVVRQLQQFPTVFHQIMLTVVSPVFARLKAAGDMAGLAHQLHLANDWVLRMAAGLILLLLILGDHVLALYGADFAEQGKWLMWVMTLAVAVNLFTGPVGMLLNMTGHHVALLRITAVTSLATLASYFFLIPAFGVVGVGLAVLLGNAVNKGAAIWLVKERLGIPWYDKRFRGWILPSLAATTVLVALRTVPTQQYGLIEQAVYLVLAAVLAYTAFFAVNLAVGLHEDDRELIRAVQGRLSRIQKGGTEP